MTAIYQLVYVVAGLKR